MNSHYSIFIQWSEEDQAYVATLPEFGEFCHTHGNTYGEALENAAQVLSLLVETYQTEGKQLPKPLMFGQHQAA